MSHNLAIEQKGPSRLHILHCLRAPVGGLFRHVLDLAAAQAAAGHRVGIVCAATGDALTETRLLALAPQLHLGLHRLPMTRALGFGDLTASRRIMTLARDLGADVLHGHGAKGGAYARLAARTLKRSGHALRCYYTPHGGSLHYAPTTPAGQFYSRLERHLENWTDGILFESRFAADRYAAQIGTPRTATRVVMNGLLPAEFVAVTPNADAADFVFVGELRMLKGVDVALAALAATNRTQRATAVIVGDGPDAPSFKAQAHALGLDGRVTFPGAMRARDAFALGRTLLVPSRAESLPYIVLEAVAASLPVIATDVGGIPEIIAPQYGPLLPAGDSAALAAAMRSALARQGAMQLTAEALRASAEQRFSVATMARSITDFYGAPALARRAA